MINEGEKEGSAGFSSIAFSIIPKEVVWFGFQQESYFESLSLYGLWLTLHWKMLVVIFFLSAWIAS